MHLVAFFHQNRNQNANFDFSYGFNKTFMASNVTGFTKTGLIRTFGNLRITDLKN